VEGSWRRLHNEELHDLHASPNVIRMIKSRRMEWAGYVSRMEAMRDAYKIFVMNLDGKGQLGKPRRM
jgi:hypothetical protein